MNDSISGTAILDILLGLSFIYFSLSMISSSILEAIVATFRLRAAFLKQAIEFLLSDGERSGIESSLSKRFFDGPLIAKKVPKFPSGSLDLRSVMRRIPYLEKKINQGPSYISNETFSENLVDVLKQSVSDPTQKRSLENGIASLGNQTQLYEMLRSLLSKSENEQEFIEKLSTWFEEYMQRQTGQYKRKTQKYLFVIGLILAASMDIDTLAYSQKLATDGALREFFVEKALNTASEPPSIKERTNATNSNSITIGELASFNELSFKEQYVKVQDISKRLSENSKQTCESTPAIPGCANQAEPDDSDETDFSVADLGVGYILTALAVSLGSSFWLDLLRAMSSIRSSIPPKDSQAESQKEKKFTPAKERETFEEQLEQSHIETLQQVLNLPAEQRTGEFNIATREAIQRWRENLNLPFKGAITLDEYLKLLDPDTVI